MSCEEQSIKNWSVQLLCPSVELWSSSKPTKESWQRKILACTDLFISLYPVTVHLKHGFAVQTRSSDHLTHVKCLLSFYGISLCGVSPASDTFAGLKPIPPRVGVETQSGYGWGPGCSASTKSHLHFLFAVQNGTKPFIAVKSALHKAWGSAALNVQTLVMLFLSSQVKIIHIYNWSFPHPEGTLFQSSWVLIDMKTKIFTLYINQEKVESFQINN